MFRISSTNWQLPVFASLLLLVSLLPVIAAESLTLLPGNITLSGPTARQALVVEKALGKDHHIGQVTENIVFSSADTNIVRIEGNVAMPVANGKTTVRAQVGKQTVTVPVLVKLMELPAETSFRNHVQPVLAKFGCSAGACHGAAAGQNGFKLSLRGYDDQGDFLSLTRNTLGRRIVPEDPGRSLLLLKATGTIPHKGGRKFEVDSPEYRVLSEWIASGTPGPKEQDTRITRVEILPAKVILKPGETQQMSVRAWFDDGHSEDVTRWTKYTDSNSSVTTVDENGNVKIMGNGEGAITAWYLQRIAIATVSVPYSNAVPAQVFAKAPRRNFIDELVNEKLRDLNLPPSPRCSDDEFIRRAFIDTIGVLPTSKETEAFLNDTSSKKRDQLIESLLKRPEFVDYWTYKWSDLLLVNSTKLKPNAMWAYYRWVRDRVERNTPWDVLVRELITAQGSTLENGAANFFVLHEDPKSLSETTSLAFLGMSINCAKCH
ncbi:MAG TPA: DUF1549 domain-containing protein, partial [Roseimicrobium sp.]|nr:DUF1549 domain-containing protein [Roseimicrobium sp.]